MLSCDKAHILQSYVETLGTSKQIQILISTMALYTTLEVFVKISLSWKTIEFVAMLAM